MGFVAQTAIAVAVLCLAIRTLARGSNNWVIRLSMTLGVLALSAFGMSSLLRGW